MVISSFYHLLQNFNPRSLTGATFCTNPINNGTVNFNPRSLTGATVKVTRLLFYISISIHAPLRERRFLLAVLCSSWHFNPRSLTGATRSNPVWYDIYKHFNPRSLTGATQSIHVRKKILNLFQSTLPYGSDRCKK